MRWLLAARILCAVIVGLCWTMLPHEFRWHGVGIIAFTLLGTLAAFMQTDMERLR